MNCRIILFCLTLLASISACFVQLAHCEKDRSKPLPSDSSPALVSILLMPDLPEQQAHANIDAMLAAAGWAVQDYKAFNPSASIGIALCEVPLKSGRCDYLLLVNRKPVGVVEAKKEGVTLSTVAGSCLLAATALRALNKKCGFSCSCRCRNSCSLAAASALIALISISFAAACTLRSSLSAFISDSCSSSSRSIPK